MRYGGSQSYGIVGWAKAVKAIWFSFLRRPAVPTMGARGGHGGSSLARKPQRLGRLCPPYDSEQFGALEIGRLRLRHRLEPVVEMVVVVLRADDLRHRTGARAPVAL